MLTKDIEQIFKQYTADKKLGGIYMAVPTGEVLKENPTYIEVLIYGKSFFAKPCMAFGSYNVPDKAWLNKYKGEIMVWVAFENGNSAHPIYLGVAPVDGSAPKNNFPEIKKYKTTEFSYYFDDKNKKFRLSKLDNVGNDTDGVEISEKGVILGKGTPPSSSVLGEKMIGKISDVIVEVSNALTKIASATVIVPPTMVGTLDPATIASLTTSVTKLSTIQAQLVDALSKNVKLD